MPVEIINPFNNKRSRHLGLIDSGSDWCSMPEEMWGELEFTEIGLMDLGTPLGWMEAGFSWCNIQIAGKTIAVEVHYTKGDEVLIGRNAMKHFVITFDGKESKTVIE